MIVADLRILALGKGTSQEAPVEEALRVLNDRNLRYEVGPMGTTIEARSMEDLLKAVRACHASVRPTAGRVFTQLTIDERLDKEETIDSLRDVETEETADLAGPRRRRR